jgi:hypothetical protein
MALKWYGNEARRHVDDRLTVRLEAAGRAGVDAAVDAAPEETGFLKSSITYAVLQRERTLQLIAAAPTPSIRRKAYRAGSRESNSWRPGWRRPERR